MGYIKPAPRDSGDWKMEDRGTQVMFGRMSLTTAVKTVKFGRDIKGFSLYVESGTCILRGTEPLSYVPLDNAAAVDAGSGRTTIAATAHGLTASDYVEIYGTTNYDTGTADNEEAQTPIAIYSVTTNSFTITKTYHAETIPATAYAIGYRDAQLSAGQSMDVPIVVEQGTTVCYLSASSTAVVSVLAWR